MPPEGDEFFSGGVNFFHSLWAESMEIIEAEYLIGSA